MDHTLETRQAVENRRKGTRSNAKVHVQCVFSSLLTPKITRQFLGHLEEFRLAVEHSKILSLELMHISRKQNYS